MEFTDVLGWVLAALFAGLAVGLYLGREREQEQVSYLRGQLREARTPSPPENVKQLPHQPQRSGGPL